MTPWGNGTVTFREGMPLSQSQNLAECLLSDDYVDVRWLLDTVYNINEN